MLQRMILVLVLLPFTLPMAASPVTVMESALDEWASAIVSAFEAVGNELIESLNHEESRLAVHELSGFLEPVGNSESQEADGDIDSHDGNDNGAGGDGPVNELGGFSDPHG